MSTSVMRSNKKLQQVNVNKTFLSFEDELFFEHCFLPIVFNYRNHYSQTLSERGLKLLKSLFGGISYYLCFLSKSN